MPFGIIPDLAFGFAGIPIPVLETEFNERDAFKAVFSFQQTLDQLNPSDVANVDKAKMNVLQLAHKSLARLQAEQRRGQQEEDKPGTDRAEVA